MRDSACKDYHMTRRHLLKTAGGTGAAMLGMPIQQLFAEIGKQHAPKAESMVLFWMGGGMSHIDTWDPKPTAHGPGPYNATGGGPARVSALRRTSGSPARTR